jgi:hypothetical protein
MDDPLRINHPKQAWFLDFACSMIAVTLVLFLVLAAGLLVWSLVSVQ